MPMDHFEMAEKLRRKTGVSYEEAKAALEAADWDMLDALLYLESKGRLGTGAAAGYTTRPREENHFYTADIPVSGKSVIERIFSALSAFIKKCNATTLEVRRRKHVVLELPATVVLLLAIIGFKHLLFAIAISLFFGFSYRFSGEGSNDTVNSMMGKASKTVEDILNGFSEKREDK